MNTRLYKQRLIRQFLSKFLILLFLILTIPRAASAEISKLVFTSEPQNINTSEISGPINIQTQDASGEAFQTPETLDLGFVSSSQTGEFLNSSGNAASKTMSVNTANKTFYYRDSSSGTFNITVNATGRTSGQKWNAEQKITIGDAGSQRSQEDSVISDQSSSAISAVGGGSSTRTTSPNASMEIYSLSDRSTTVGSPLQFQAAIKKNSANGKLEFNWSFGDGATGFGQLVFHTYEYPGNYAAVLNVRAGETFSVNRFKVKVLEPSITVKEAEKYLEIVNESDSEVNLFNWKIEHLGRGFIFQPDTILLPKAGMKISKSLLTMKGLDNSQNTVLKNSLGEVVFDIASQSVQDINKKMNEINGQLIKIQAEAAAVKFAAEPGIRIADEKSEEILPATSSVQTEKVLYEAPKRDGVFSKLTNFLKRVFSH